MFDGRIFTAAAATLLALSCASPLCAGSPDKLTAAEARGKIIFNTGRTAAGGRLSYRIASGDESLPTRNGCANCHGEDAKGRQGDVLTPSITYKILVGPAELGRRTRTAYESDELIARAITEGIDSSDNRLNIAMPRWVLSNAEMRDLLAYLKRLRE